MNPNIIKAGVKIIIAQVGPELKEQFFKAVESLEIWANKKIGEINWERKFENILKRMSGPQIPENIKITPVKKECISKAELVEIAKQNIVPNSNEVLAMLNDKAKSFYYIYLAYSKDKEMLDQDKNNFVIIQADALAKDIQSLFNGNELIILK